MPVIMPGRTLAPVTKRPSRLQFSWDARDLSLTARSGQVGQFTRTSTGYAIDSLGRYRLCQHSQPRWQWEDRDGDGFRETATLLLGAAGANLIAQPDDFTTGAGWSQTGVTSVTPNAATFAGLSFSRIVGSATTTQISRAVTFTGDGIKAYSIVVRAQPGVNGKDAFVIHDNTSNADRLVVTIIIAADGTVTAAASTGSVKLEKLADGAYRVLMTTTSVTASHSHSVWVSDIGGAVGTGGVTDRFYACAQVENAIFPSSPMPLGLLSRSGDLLRFPFNATPQIVSLYVSIIERFPLAGVHRFLQVSTSGSSAFDLYRSPATGVAEWGGSDSNGAAQVAMGDPAFGDVLEMGGSWNVNGQTAPLSAPVKIEAAINGGAVVSATNPAGSRLPASWTDPFVYFNGYGGVDCGMVAARLSNVVRGLTDLRTAV